MKLTGREWEALELYAQGYSFENVAERMGISRKTAQCYRYQLFLKTGAGNIVEMLRSFYDFVPKDALAQRLKGRTA